MYAEYVQELCFCVSSDDIGRSGLNALARHCRLFLSFSRSSPTTSASTEKQVPPILLDVYLVTTQDGRSHFVATAELPNQIARRQKKGSRTTTATAETRRNSFWFSSSYSIVRLISQWWSGQQTLVISVTALFHLFPYRLMDRASVSIYSTIIDVSIVLCFFCVTMAQTRRS